MAQYRFSAQVIGRSSGRSSVAAAAYRAGQDLTDERTGLTHDFTRRSGVVSAEIIAPDHAPEWVHDRAKLWNAIEAIEKRSNSQLARELQLSLPHELTDAQRRELLHDFIREQFVARGMVADVAIHRPDRDSDDRNHHAHVMLTMREITRDGFHAKKATDLARSWNATELVELWREAWAVHQNRQLERHGHESRVDHRSFDARGIDREPTQHMGPKANDMERRGEPSRIGDKNRETEARNDDRAEQHREAAIADLAAEQERRRQQTPEPNREAAPRLVSAWTDRQQSDERDALEAQIAETYASRVATLTEARDRYASRMEATGWRKILRMVTGQNRADQIRLQETKRALAAIERETTQQRQSLERRQQADLTGRDRTDTPTARDYWTPATPAQNPPAEATPLRDYWSRAADGNSDSRDYWSSTGPSRSDGPSGPEPEGPER